MPKVSLHIHPFELRLRHTFRIAHGSRDVQPSVIVELRAGAISGYGEATATTYYQLKQDEMCARLAEIKPAVEGIVWEEPATFHTALLSILPDEPALRCALDVAAHDLWGKQQSRSLYEIWGWTASEAVPSSYTIGLGTVSEMTARIRETPWPIYKIKLGTDHDLAIIKALRAETKAIFRVDANTGWTTQQAVTLSHELAALGVEFIEQPLAADDWEGHRYLYEHSPLPVIADESCQGPEDITRCADCFHGINIKLLKCGGLTPARAMIEQAKALGLKTMIGCMTESSVGISAIAQLAPALDYIDIDGAMLISNDPAQGIQLRPDGSIRYSELGGTGASLRRT